MSVSSCTKSYFWEWIAGGSAHWLQSNWMNFIIIVDRRPRHLLHYRSTIPRRDLTRSRTVYPFPKHLLVLGCIHAYPVVRATKQGTGRIVFHMRQATLVCSAGWCWTSHSTTLIEKSIVPGAFSCMTSGCGVREWRGRNPPFPAVPCLPAPATPLRVPRVTRPPPGRAT